MYQCVCEHEQTEHNIIDEIGIYDSDGHVDEIVIAGKCSKCGCSEYEWDGNTSGMGKHEYLRR